MATIYISSTFEDLKTHRRRVYQALRRLGHDVKAMEDYVAADQRPLDKCLADVEKCDVYVGIFAWRYGYTPATGNPTRRSITELEYRSAEGKPRLVFLTNESARWPSQFVDRGKAADSIKALRAELSRNNTVSFFGSAHELAELVAASVTNWEKEDLRATFPRLSLRLLNQATRNVSAVRDLAQDVRHALVDEHIRRGLPSLDWLTATLVACKKRTQTAGAFETTVPREEREPQWGSTQSTANETEKYALALLKWHKEAGAQIVFEHYRQRKLARAFELDVEILNSGRAPADNVTIELTFPNTLLINKWETAWRDIWLPGPPVMPPELKEELQKQFPQRDVKRTHSYDPVQRTQSGTAEWWPLHKHSPGHQTVRAAMGRLEHGSSAHPRSVHVSLDDQPARDVMIRFRLHASNQPDDTVGELVVPVVEGT